MLTFLSLRAIPQVEDVEHGVYRRTVSLDGCSGCIAVEDRAEDCALVVRVDTELVAVAPKIGCALHHLFDLGADSTKIDSDLVRHAILAPLVRQRRGLRVPGAFDGFELAWRAVLGQQVSVRGATTLAGRFAQRFGKAITTPCAELSVLSPQACRVAQSSPERIAKIGIPQARAKTLHELAKLVVSNPGLLDCDTPSQLASDQLLALPGVGPWTVQYILMRALRYSEAIPVGDLGLKKALAESNPKEIAKMAERWRPWQSYATMHLWASL